MIATLENLSEKIKENRLKNLAINIVKFQKFKTSAILARIDNAGYTQSTLVSTIAHGIGYIKTGKTNKKLGNLCKYIDEAIADCVQPLTPSASEYRKDINYKRKTNNKANTNKQLLPVQDTLENIYQQSNHKTEIAVQLGNNIRICKNLEQANIFIEGIIFAGKFNAKIVDVKVIEK